MDWLQLATPLALVRSTTLTSSTNIGINTNWKLLARVTAKKSTETKRKNDVRKRPRKRKKCCKDPPTPGARQKKKNPVRPLAAISYWSMAVSYVASVWLNTRHEIGGHVVSLFSKTASIENLLKFKQKENTGQRVNFQGRANSSWSAFSWFQSCRLECGLTSSSRTNHLFNLQSVGLIFLNCGSVFVISPRLNGFNFHSIMEKSKSWDRRLMIET